MSGWAEAVFSRRRAPVAAAAAAAVPIPRLIFLALVLLVGTGRTGRLVVVCFALGRTLLAGRVGLVLGLGRWSMVTAFFLTACFLMALDFVRCIFPDLRIGVPGLLTDFLTGFDALPLSDLPVRLTGFLPRMLNLLLVI